MTNAICLKTRPEAKYRLFCLPYAGGLGTATYRPWIELLPETIELYSIEYPGRPQVGGTPQTKISDLVDILFNDIKNLLDLPFIIYAHSFGSLIAFELTRKLQQEKRPMPKHLVVSSRRSPQVPHHGESLRDVDDSDFVDIMIKNYDAIPKVLLDEPDLMKLFLPILRADMNLNEQHIEGEDLKIDSPITLLVGSEEDYDIETMLKPWSKLTRAEFKMLTYRGDHFFINTTENRTQLIKLIVKSYEI